MAIYFSSSFGLIINGDGVSSVFKYDLEDYPFSVPFNKTFPDSVLVLATSSVGLSDGSGPDTSYTILASINKSVLTITFNKPLVAEFPPNPSGAGAANIQLLFIFNSQ